MAKFEDYKVRVDTYAPGLRPKYNPDDHAAIIELYSDLESRLDGIDEKFKKLGVERIVVDIVKRGGLADDEKR